MTIYQIQYRVRRWSHGREPSEDEPVEWLQWNSFRLLYATNELADRQVRRQKRMDKKCDKVRQYQYRILPLEVVDQ